MKKIALLLTIICAGQLYGMDPTSLYELRRTGPERGRYKGFGDLPQDIKGLVVLTLAQSDTMEEAIQAIRSLTETDTAFNIAANDPIIIRAIIRILAQKFNAPSEYIAQQLSTKGSEQYVDLSKSLIATLWQGAHFHYFDAIEKSAEDLINAGADIDFQTADTYPMVCGSSDDIDPTVIYALEKLAASLPQTIETQQIIANIKQIAFKKWPELYIHRKKQPKFLEKEVTQEVISIFMEMDKFRRLSKEEQKQKLLTSKKYSQELLAHFEESVKKSQSDLQATVQLLKNTFPNDKQWKKLSEEISKGKLQKALDIVTLQQPTKYKGILVFIRKETNTCIIGANFSLVMYAIATNQPTILEWLIKHKANLNLTMGAGDTALLMAMSMGRPQMAELLINNGANINQKGTLNEETDRALRKLNGFGINVNLANSYFDAAEHALLPYYDPILYSLLNGNELISIMADALLGVGIPPLFRLIMMLIYKKLFSEEEFNALFTLLISKGADPNIQENSYGVTALMALALVDGHANLIKSLLDYGADPFIKNNKSMTALDYMKSERRENDPELNEKIRLLEEAMKKERKQ